MSDEPPARHGLGLRRVGQDASSTMAVSVWSIGLGLALSIFLARTLGPEGNGLYALALLLPTTLAQLLNLGVSPANVYFVGRGDVTLGKALRATTRLGVIMGLLGLAIAPLVVHHQGEQWFPGVPPSLMLLALAAYPIGLFQSYYATLLTAVKDFRRFNRTLAVMPLVTIVLAAVLVLYGGMGVAGAVFAYLAGQLAGVLASRLSLRAHLDSDREAAGGESWWAYGRRCIAYGRKAHLSNILAFVNYRVDILLVNLFLGPVLVGVYFVAVQVAERLWLPSKVLSTVLLPRMAELHAHADTRELTPLMSRLVLWGTVAVCLAVAVIAEPALRLLFGHQFLGAVQPLLWLLPGIALAGGSRIVANDFAARGRPEWNSWLSVLTLVVNIAGNVTLVPRYGINGAAIATTIAYTLNMVVRMLIYTRVAGVPWHEQVVPRRSDLRLVAAAVRLGGHAVAGRVRRG